MLALAIGLLLIPLLAACGSRTSVAEEGTAVLELPVISAAGKGDPIRILEAGELAPDFVLTYENGDAVMLSDWRGQPVVVNFWATWCAPCRAEMPELVEAYEAHKDDGLVIVGVNIQESAEKASQFVDEFKMTFPVALDSRGEMEQLFAVRGLPTTLFIDRQGRISVRWAGLLTAELLQEYLSEIL